MAFLDTEGFDRLWAHIQHALANFIPKTRKVNGKELADDIILSASDVGAAEADHSHNYVSLAPADGEAIPENSDLNTVDFLRVGTYFISSYTKAMTLINSPTSDAFLMHVYCPNSFNSVGKEATNTWVYRLRKIITVDGDEYTQYVHSESTVGEFDYREWTQTIKTNTKLVIGSQNYGTELPDTGVEGQVFFKKVT